MPRPEAPVPGPAEDYTLNFTSRASGMSYTLTAKVGVPVEIPEGLGKFVVMAYEAVQRFAGWMSGRPERNSHPTGENRWKCCFP
jgi:hypothetical protein